MKQMKRFAAIALMIALLLTCATAFAKKKQPVQLEKYLYKDIDKAGSQLSLKRTQKQSDEAYLTMYENNHIMLGGRNGQVIDVNIFGGNYSLYGVTVGMTLKEAKAKLNKQKIAYREDEVVEIGQQELIFEVPGHNESTVCFDLSGGIIEQANVNTDVEAFEAAQAIPESGYIKLTASAHLRKRANKKSDSLLVIDKGTKLQYTTTAEDSKGVTWFKVKYDGKTGWVYSKYSKQITKKEYEKKVDYKEKEAYGVIRLTGRVNVRKLPDKESKSLDVFAEESELAYTATAKDSRGVVWYKVSADGVTGWISSKNVEKVD